MVRRETCTHHGVLAVVGAGSTTSHGETATALSGPRPTDGQATLHYADGSTQTATLGLTGWSLPTGSAPSYGNTIVARLSHGNDSTTNEPTSGAAVFAASIPLQGTSKLVSVTLPSVGDPNASDPSLLHVFAMKAGS